MGKPTRTFNAIEGQKSGQSIDQLKNDIDNLCAALDPNAVFKDGSKGGIGAENIKEAFTETLLADVTLNQDTALTDTGKYSVLLSALAAAVKLLKGTTNWKDSPEVSIAYLNANKSNIGHTHGLSVDGHSHSEFYDLDLFGVSGPMIVDANSVRDENGNLTEITLLADTNKNAKIKYHRDSLSRIDCMRLQPQVDTDFNAVQIEVVRDANGKIGRWYKSGLNATLLSGGNWPISY